VDEADFGRTIAAHTFGDAYDDTRPWRAYAAWLKRRDEPRGWLMEAQLAAEAAPGDVRLASEEQRLLRLVVPRLIGDLAGDERIEITFRRGVPEHVWCWPMGSTDARVLERFFAIPSGRLVRTIVVGGKPTWTAVDVLAAAGALPALVSLVFPGSFGALGSIEPLYALAPGLRMLLVLHDGGTSFGRPRLPHATTFGGTVPLGRDDLAALAQGELPAVSSQTSRDLSPEARARLAAAYGERRELT
jgi:hypothetical protein